MPHVSRRKMSDKLWERLWGRLVGLLTKSNCEVEVEAVLVGLLTPTERVMVAKRLMVGILALSGWSAYEIAEALKMSVATVYKLKAYLRLDAKYRRFVRKVYPDKVKQTEQKARSKGELEKLVEDMFVGYRKRSRLVYPHD